MTNFFLLQPDSHYGEVKSCRLQTSGLVGWPDDSTPSINMPWRAQGIVKLLREGANDYKTSNIKILTGNHKTGWVSLQNLTTKTAKTP